MCGSAGVLEERIRLHRRRKRGSDRAELLSGHIFVSLGMHFSRRLVCENLSCLQDSPPTDHWPNIISLLQDNKSHSQAESPSGAQLPEASLYFYDHSVHFSYFISRTSARTSVVVICADQRSPNDRVISEFLRTIRRKLLLDDAFELLHRGGQ